MVTCQLTLTGGYVNVTTATLRSGPHGPWWFYAVTRTETGVRGRNGRLESEAQIRSCRLLRPCSVRTANLSRLLIEHWLPEQHCATNPVIIVLPLLIYTSVSDPVPFDPNPVLKKNRIRILLIYAFFILSKQNFYAIFLSDLNIYWHSKLEIKNNFAENIDLLGSVC